MDALDLLARGVSNGAEYDAEGLSSLNLTNVGAGVTWGEISQSSDDSSVISAGIRL